MKESPLPDPRTAAYRLGTAARDLVGDVAEGYRKSTRYFKLRAAIVATWLALSLASMWIACPGSGPGNGLGAQVNAIVVTEGLGMQVLVENRSSRAWTNVALVLEGGWRLERPWVQAGEKVVVPVANFRKDGANAPRDLKPRTLAIECDQGSVTAPLASR
jgi:hypothetical protein